MNLNRTQVKDFAKTELLGNYLHAINLTNADMGNPPPEKKSKSKSRKKPPKQTIFYKPKRALHIDTSLYPDPVAMPIPKKGREPHTTKAKDSK